MDNNKRLYRSKNQKIIAGVCGGLAEYFNIDPVIVRIIFVILALGNGAGILLYIVLAIVLPEEPEAGKQAKKVDKEQIKRNARVFAEDIKMKTQDWKKDYKKAGNFATTPNIIALIIILIGLYFLLQAVIPFHFISWRFVWPSIIIIVGLILLLSTKKGK